MNSELVSIVMATFNGGKYLREQINSILEQTYQDFELIVVDDGSTDETLSILDEYSALDDRIHVFPADNNLGLVANFERGLKLANGDFIALSDQDDIFRKDKIDLLVTELKAHPDRDLVISDLSLIDENGIEISQSMWLYQKLSPKQGKPFRRLLYSNFATGCAMMLRRRLLEIALPFPFNCHTHDWWLAVVSASFKGGGICLINEPLTAYRQHRSNVIGARALSNLTARKIVARIKSPPRGKSIAEARMNGAKLNIPRLDGYLKRDIWTVKERLIINRTKDMFEGYLTDVHSSLMSRIFKLPQRIRCAATTKSVAHCLGVIHFTIWPFK